MATERKGERRGERGTDARVLRAMDIRSERRKFWEEVLRLAGVSWPQQGSSLSMTVAAEGSNHKPRRETSQRSMRECSQIRKYA
jgi:hypothetical protein